MRIEIYVDASNISLSGGYAMRYDILKEFCLNGISPTRLTAYLVYDKERVKEKTYYPNQVILLEIELKNISKLGKPISERLVKVKKNESRLFKNNLHFKYPRPRYNRERDIIDKKHLKKLIINNEILKVFELMLLIEDEDINDEIILLNRRWNENEQRNTLRIENIDGYMIEKNRIVKAILGILKK